MAVAFDAVNHAILLKQACQQWYAWSTIYCLYWWDKRFQLTQVNEPCQWLLTLNLQLLPTGLWLTDYPLILQKKTKFVLFQSYHKVILHKNCTLYIYSNPVIKVNSFKFLGVYTFDEHLTWHEHFTITSIKIAKNIGLISRIGYLLPCSVLLSLY